MLSICYMTTWINFMMWICPYFLTNRYYVMSLCLYIVSKMLSLLSAYMYLRLFHLISDVKSSCHTVRTLLHYVDSLLRYANTGILGLYMRITYFPRSAGTKNGGKENSRRRNSRRFGNGIFKWKRKATNDWQSWNVQRKAFTLRLWINSNGVYFNLIIK